MYKQVHLEIDVNNKSDRTEWGHCKYHSFYRPDSAFELVVQWVAASGTVVADLVCKNDIYSFVIFQIHLYILYHRFQDGRENRRHVVFR